jgi:hypothetical protein
MTKWVTAGYAKHQLPFDTPVEERWRSLCPPDFGFHNALRRASGELVFIDFDYFGWDDSVKVTCDFLLHPGMRLFRDVEAAFCRQDSGDLSRRRVLCATA